MLAEPPDLIGEVSPVIRRWWDELKAREGFEAALARERG